MWKWTPLRAPLARRRGERVAVGGAAVQVVGEDDRDAGLGGGADGDPAEVIAGDVVAQLEAERVAVEGQREVGVMDEDEALGESEVHALKAREPGAASRFSDPARLAARAGEVPGDAARHARERAVVTRPVGRRRLAHQLGEAGAEGAERRTPDLPADLGDRQLATAQQRLRPLDSPRHQVRVGRLPVRGAELPREVRGGHQRGAAERGDVERARVLAVHQIAGAAQVREVGEFLRRHAAPPARTTPGRSAKPPWSKVRTCRSRARAVAAMMRSWAPRGVPFRRA